MLGKELNKNTSRIRYIFKIIKKINKNLSEK